jgi:peptidoglycan-N-acetylglucosamine deacetylase
MTCALANRIQYGLSVAGVFSLSARSCLSTGFTSEPADRPIVAPARPEEIALTFDNGPNINITPRLVDMLTLLGIRATFFLYGELAREEPYLTRYIVDCGHLVGTHTWSQTSLRFHSLHHLRENLYRSRNTMEQITGKSVRYFRPPRGARRPGVIAAARTESMVSVLWNVKTADWRTGSPERIYRQLITRIDAARSHSRAANVVLQHGRLLMSGDDPPMEAIRRLVERYRAVRRFVTVDRWCTA